MKALLQSFHVNCNPLKHYLILHVNEYIVNVAVGFWKFKINKRVNQDLTVSRTTMYICKWLYQNHQQVIIPVKLTL